jgi:peptide/nickel transport system permease protein
MKIEADNAKGASEAGELTSRSPRELAWRRFKKNKVGIAAMCTSLFFVSAAVFAPVVAWAMWSWR